MGPAGCELDADAEEQAVERRPPRRTQTRTHRHVDHVSMLYAQTLDDIVRLLATATAAVVCKVSEVSSLIYDCRRRQRHACENVRGGLRLNALEITNL